MALSWCTVTNMALSATNPDTSSSLRAHSIGDNLNRVIMNFTANSGDTSGTITVSPLKTLLHILMLGGKLTHTAAPTYSGNVATLAFIVPVETAAAKTYQSALTVTAVANSGAAGNSITVAFTAGGTAGAEVVTVTGTAISIRVESGVSTAAQVNTAFAASAAAVALATMAVVGGHTADAISSATASALTGGVTGGVKGTLLAIGR